MPRVESSTHVLRAGRVLRVRELDCDVWSGVVTSAIRFAPMFPSPRIERVSPGHLLAVATEPDGGEAVVWRWYDAVVLGPEPDGSIRLWEPAHGEVVAQPRPTYDHPEPGSRAYACAGLPGADWWVGAGVAADPRTVEVELDEVDKLYAENDLWPAVFG